MTVTRKGWQPPAIPWNQFSIDRSQQTTGEVAGKAILYTAGLYLALKGIQWACRKCTGTAPKTTSSTPPSSDVRQVSAELSQDVSMDLLPLDIREDFLPTLVNYWLAPSEFSRKRVLESINRVSSLQIPDSPIGSWCEGLAGFRSLLDVDVFRVCAFLQIDQTENVRKIGADWISLYNQVLVVQEERKECFDPEIEALVRKSQKEGIDPKVVSLLQLYIQQVASKGYPEGINSEQCKQMRQALAILLVADFSKIESPQQIESAFSSASATAVKCCEDLLRSNHANISKLWGEVILDWVSYHAPEGDKTVTRERFTCHLNALKKELLSLSNQDSFEVPRGLAIVENMLETPGFQMETLVVLTSLPKQKERNLYSFMKNYEEILVSFF